MRYWNLFISIILLSFFGDNASGQGTVVIPRAYESSNAPGSYSWRQPGVYQQLFSGDSMAVVPYQMEIDKISFRGEFTPSGTISYFQIGLGTFKSSINNFPPGAWQENRPNDFKIVYASSDIAFNSTDDFQIQFNLDNPFIFTPSNGQLFMEIYKGGSTGSIEVDATESNEVRWTDTGNLQVFNFGFVTKIEFRQVPEPKPLDVFLVLGLLMFLLNKFK